MSIARTGRRPKPTSIKIAAGNPGKAALNRNEPVPPVGRMRSPVALSKRAAEHWRRVVPVLERMGVGTTADVATLARYCETLAAWEIAAAFVAEHGTTYPLFQKRPRIVKRKGKSVKSYPISGYAQYPQVSQMNTLSKHLLSLECEFGLTPAARSKIEAPAPPGKPNDDDVDAPDPDVDAKRSFFQNRDSFKITPGAS